MASQDLLVKKAVGQFPDPAPDEPRITINTMIYNKPKTSGNQVNPLRVNRGYPMRTSLTLRKNRYVNREVLTRFSVGRSKRSRHSLGKLGLPRGAIRFVPYQGVWPVLFEIERRRLERVLNDRTLDIQHVGSTSINGLRAKPIIDVLIVGASNRSPLSFRKQLAAAGFRLSRTQPVAGHVVFVKGRPVSFILHFVSRGSPSINRFLRFRDALRKHSGLADEYERLKVKLSQLHQDSRLNYARAKDDFVARVTADGRVGN